MMQLIMAIKLCESGRFNNATDKSGQRKHHNCPRFGLKQIESDISPGGMNKYEYLVKICESEAILNLISWQPAIPR